MKKMSSFRLDEVVSLRLSALSSEQMISQSDVISELVNFAFYLSCIEYSEQDSSVVFETLRRSFSDRLLLHQQMDS